MYWSSHAASGHANFVCLYKEFWIKISQIVLNSGDCFVIGGKMLQTKQFLQVWRQMEIRGCNVWRIGTMIQFNEAILSNSSLNTWMGAWSWRSTAPRLTLLRSFSTMTERSRLMIDASEGPLIVIPRGRYSVSRTPSLYQKMIIIIFPADLSWRSRVGICSSDLFQILASSCLRES